MKARVFVIGGAAVGRSFEVDGEAVMGRSPECEIPLRHRSISRRHARISWDGTAWIVEDLESRNGVRVQGRRVKRAEVEDHDEIILGDLPLRFRIAGPAAAKAPALPLEPASVEPEPEPEVEMEPELELEEEIDLEEDDSPVSADSTMLSGLERRRAEVLRQGSSRGLLGGDLAQRPLWVKALLFLLLSALAVGMCFLFFLAVRTLRGSV